jgi:hypothetical protein
MSYYDRMFNEEQKDQDKEESFICAKCFNYQVHHSGVSEKCTSVNRYIDKQYFYERLNGNKKTCKDFYRL